MPYGYTNEEWEAAKAESKPLLYQRAAQPVENVLTYTELTNLIQTIRFDPDEFGFWEFLGEISTEEYLARRGMLTAIVVRATGEHRPGPGFIKCARSLGLTVADPDATWIEQLNFVQDYWRRNWAHWGENVLADATANPSNRA